MPNKSGDRANPEIKEDPCPIKVNYLLIAPHSVIPTKIYINIHII